MNSFLERLNAGISRPRNILILFLLAMGIRALMAIPQDPSGLNPILAQMSDHRIPDVRLSYSSDELYLFMEELGDAGRTAYGRMLLSLDLVFPFAYGLCLTGLMHYLLNFPGIGRWRALALLPATAVLSDLSENFITVFLLKAYPARHTGLAEFTSLLKIPKFGLLALVFVLIPVLLTVRLIRLRRERD